MTCFHPQVARQPIAGGSPRFIGSTAQHGEWLLPAKRKQSLSDGFRVLELSCGQCVGCRLGYACHWASRMMCETQLWPQSWFVTLTYEDAPLSLEYADVQAAWHRLRYYSSFRHTTAGEYGSLTMRPHYHAALFNLTLDDLQPWRKSSAGFQLYRSKFFEEKIWPHGHVEIGELSFESCAYIAGYVVKKAKGRAANVRDARTGLLPYERVTQDGDVVSVTPEFLHMSLKPAIGVPWLEKFHGDIYNVYDALIVDGSRRPVPKAFDRWLEGADAKRFVEVKAKRVERALEHAQDCTPDRLEVREVCARARLKMKARSL